ncbi:MAG: dihydroorotase [Pelagibacteraceae bacterium TMED65]|nr:dihydroorotase [Rickettsiales bacterium]OUU51389.1 MAG: dihydroorotase [Pelagibacteraceae bacterium TMED65]|tara:strand:+ start:801 stop:2123 length:1323 start_codon:yes stop_codon:yes gene_type:complete
MNSKNKTFFDNTKKSQNFLLKGGIILDPNKKRLEKKDILIKDKIIAEINQAINYEIDECITIDCEGLYVSPGIVDMRVNLGEPGFEHKETIKSACQAAASGGITTMICMPNTSPVIDHPAIIQSIQRKAREVALSKVYCTGSVTRGTKGIEISELQLMKESGAVGFTDGNKSVANARVMKRALNYVKSFNGLIIQHAEEPELSHNGVVNEGEVSTRLGLTGIPSYTEAMIVERDLWLVKDTKCRYHVSHVSTKETVDIIRNAKKSGIQITCDTAPPYFLLNELAIENYRTFSKLSPPLRTERDRKEIINGIIDGTIDAIVSDHTPQDQDAKRLPFNQAAFGGVGLETLLPLTLSLVKNTELDLITAISLITKNPSDILGLNSGCLKLNSEADISIFDLDKPWKVKPENFHSKSKNSPFDSILVQGKNLITFVRGRLVYKF